MRSSCLCLSELRFALFPLSPTFVAPRTHRQHADFLLGAAWMVSPDPELFSHSRVTHAVTTGPQLPALCLLSPIKDFRLTDF